jgi:hypothetical protein
MVPIVFLTLCIGIGIDALHNSLMGHTGITSPAYSEKTSDKVPTVQYQQAATITPITSIYEGHKITPITATEPKIASTVNTMIPIQISPVLSDFSDVSSTRISAPVTLSVISSVPLSISATVVTNSSAPVLATITTPITPIVVCTTVLVIGVCVN